MTCGTLFLWTNCSLIYLELACTKLDENLKNWLSYGYLKNILCSAQKIIGAHSVKTQHFFKSTHKYKGEELLPAKTENTIQLNLLSLGTDMVKKDNQRIRVLLFLKNPLFTYNIEI